MKAGKYIVICGAILGILSIFLFYVMPEAFYLWGIDTTGYPGHDVSFYLGGFYSGAYSYGGPLRINFIQNMETTMLLVSVLMVVGFAIMLIGGLTGKRGSGLGGGITMLCGPLFLALALLAGTGIFEELASILSLVGKNLLFGNLTEMGVTINWGVGNSFYLALTGGALGTIGGALMGESRQKMEQKRDYMNVDWLKHQYHDLHRSIQEIADEQGISVMTMKYYLDKVEN
jgi:hypothetical protein